MPNPGIATEKSTHFDLSFFQKEIAPIAATARKQFDLLVRKYALFHITCVLIIAVEIAVFFFTLFFASMNLLTLQLPLLVLTFFFYFVVRIYLQNKKQARLMFVMRNYLASCRETLPLSEGSSQYHTALAFAASELAESFYKREYQYYIPSKRWQMLSASCAKLSCYLHWKEVHMLQEMLLHYCIGQHIQIVKNEPTQLNVHASLAQAYLMLASLYVHPSKLEGYDENLWYASERLSIAMQEKFCAVAAKAIEELKILNDYAPSQPWIHAQLAYIYHDLQMVDEEIAEYEFLLRLLPEDQEILFKLGMLYFQQGHNAKGLKIYEEIKHISYKRAEELIWFYGSCQA